MLLCFCVMFLVVVCYGMVLVRDCVGVGFWCYVVVWCVFCCWICGGWKILGCSWFDVEVWYVIVSWFCVWWCGCMELVVRLSWFVLLLCGYWVVSCVSFCSWYVGFVWLIGCGSWCSWWIDCFWWFVCFLVLVL